MLAIPRAVTGDEVAVFPFTSLLGPACDRELCGTGGPKTGPDRNVHRVMPMTQRKSIRITSFPQGDDVDPGKGNEGKRCAGNRETNQFKFPKDWEKRGCACFDARLKRFGFRVGVNLGKDALQPM